MELFNLFGKPTKGKRTFTIYQVKQGNRIIKKLEGGRFISTNPSSAAKKALTSICKQMKKKTGCNYTITLHEMRMVKKFTYKCQRKKLKKPIVVDINGQKVTYKYKTVVKKKKD